VTALVWFRRDLRVHDHPALRAALERHERVVPVFCLDDRLLHGPHASGARTKFLLECLRDLDASLRERGGRLVVCHGAPEHELVVLARETGADELHHTHDVSPFARMRGQRVHAAMQSAGVSIHAHSGLSVADDVRAIRNRQGRPYSLFTPFFNTWREQERRPVLRAPQRVQLPAGVAVGRIPALASLGLAQELQQPARGGEAAARERLDRFLRGPVERYATRHDALAEDGTSRLSPYLRFGCISPRAIEQRLGAHLGGKGPAMGEGARGEGAPGQGAPGQGAPGQGAPGEGAQAFRRQLCWRDFYSHVLYHFPSNAKQEFQARYRGTLAWNDDEDAFTAWCEGRTGYPLVDAGMRQLAREGWMHNRARMVVGSFLTKDLGIDWRRGERWFTRMLLDGEPANNNGNWQWIASVGTDPQPVFRRIYNPTLHMERFDPDGRYVREYVPELRAVPAEHMREPWLMPSELQRKLGCVIGRDYPAPIVDRKLARQQALERYRVASAS
jgi:deoxyribodipyrimidine photo-lyase